MARPKDIRFNQDKMLPGADYPIPYRVIISVIPEGVQMQCTRCNQFLLINWGEMKTKLPYKKFSADKKHYLRVSKVVVTAKCTARKAPKIRTDPVKTGSPEAARALMAKLKTMS
jgi:molybdenum cofactor biosynthesis enzyme MoaA